MAGPSQIWLRGGMRGACGDMPGVGEPMGTDPRTRDISAGGGSMKLVPTVWVQRAANAWFASMSIADRIVVDGVAGSQTLGALDRIRTRILASLPTSIAVPQIADTGHVAIDRQMFDAMTAQMRIADPAGSTVALCSWSAVPRTVNTSTTTTGETVTGPAPSDSIPVEGQWSAPGGWSVESIVVPAIAFLGAAAVGFGLMKYGAPKRGRRS